MDVEGLFKKLEFKPSKSQRKAITTTEGPVFIIAGPGSGKTQTLILRTLNLLVCEGVPSENVMVCTFTEKAAATLKDRLRQSLLKLGMETEIDITDLYVDTIHSICNEIIRKNLDKLEDIGYSLSRGYDVLDDLTQQLFLFENYYQILRKNEPFARGKWSAIRKAAQYFDRITEELINPDELEDSGDEFLSRVGKVYKRYVDRLNESNSIDFAHQQRIVLDMLLNDDIGPDLRSQFKYVMVDEYQDTNHVQELLFLELTKHTKNLCVVGDEDQSLYRFRGATVQNILQFETHFEDLSPIVLDLNYRSRPSIIDFVNEFMNTGEWERPSGEKYRYDKEIKPVRKAFGNGLPSVVKILEKGGSEQTAELIRTLIDEGVVDDPNQIAILLKSVRFDSAAIMQSLEHVGVKFYAPRAKGYFEQEDVKSVIGALLFVFDFLADEDNVWHDQLLQYYEDCSDEFLASASEGLQEKAEELRNWVTSSTQLKGRQKGVVDLFYELLGHEPFSTWRDHEPYARNMSILSELLTKYQEYYHQRVISVDKRDKISRWLFNSFIYMLWSTGLDEYESPYDIFPSGTVQIMTVHQAKGLEFPVVITDSLHKQVRGQSGPQQRLSPYMKRKPYEPPDMIAEFDYRRLYYVAFSRAMDLLVVYSDKKPGWVFRGFIEDVPEVDKSFMKKVVKEHLESKKMLPVKPEYGIVGDIHVYDVCPRQYLLYNKFEYSPSIGGQFKFGQLVHHTIEDIHNHYLNGKGELTDVVVKHYFDKNHRGITKGGTHPIAGMFVAMALKQVKEYVENNKDTFEKIIAAEVPINVEKKEYILNGVIDLIKGQDGKPELLDFKAQQRDKGQANLEFYKQQLALYGKIVELKKGIKPERFKIYWTAEEDSGKSVQELDISERDSDEAERHFEDVVDNIRNGDFKVRNAPPRDTCRNCDFRFGCKDCSL